MTDSGFFVKVGAEYKGPFGRLNEARDEARRIGPDLDIYHGFLKYKKDKTLDTSCLSLIPKLRTE